MVKFIKSYWWIFAWIFVIISLHFVTRPYTVEKPRDVKILSAVSGMAKYGPAHYLIVEYKGKVLEIRCSASMVLSVQRGDTAKLYLSDMFIHDVSWIVYLFEFLKWLMIVGGVIILIILALVWVE